MAYFIFQALFVSVLSEMRTHILLDIIACLEVLDMGFILAVTLSLSARNYPPFYWMNLSELFLTNMNGSHNEQEQRIPAPLFEVVLNEHRFKSEVSDCNQSRISLASD